jgi:hypothetical protein
LIISVVWLSISIALLGVLGCQAVGPSASRVSVQGLTSSLDSTTSRSSRTKLVALKLDRILLFKIALLYTARNVAKKAFLLI